MSSNGVGSNGNGNGSAIWRLIATTLAGVVATGIAAWLTWGRDAARRTELDSLAVQHRAELHTLEVMVRDRDSDVADRLARIETQLSEILRRLDRAEQRRAEP